MADRESLDNLIEGLAGAVVEAQNRIESHQINNFLSFFDRDKRPKKIDVLVPSLHPDRIGEDVRYRVPLLPLVASSLLRIKEVEISFDTDLVGITEDDIEEGQREIATPSPGEEELVPKKLRSINLDIRGAGVHRSLYDGGDQFHHRCAGSLFGYLIETGAVGGSFIHFHGDLLG